MLAFLLGKLGLWRLLFYHWSIITDPADRVKEAHTDHTDNIIVMPRTLLTPEQYQALIATEDAVAVYFSARACAVCHALWPRLQEMFATRFPRITLARVECDAAPQLAAQHEVFTTPTLLVYFAGQEHVRQARHFSPSQIAHELSRPYALFFAD